MNTGSRNLNLTPSTYLDTANTKPHCVSDTLGLNALTFDLFLCVPRRNRCPRHVVTCSTPLLEPESLTQGCCRLMQVPNSTQVLDTDSIA